MVGKSVNRIVGVSLVTALLNGTILTAQTVASAHPEVTKSAPVTIGVVDVPLLGVLQMIAHQAGLRLFLGKPVYEQTKRVSLSLRNVTVEDALAEALTGTGLKAVIASGIVAFERDGAMGNVSEGIVTGTVIDGRTKLPLRGAMVFLDDASKGVVTGEDGMFRIGNVPPGAHTLHARLLGYEKAVQTVVINDAQVSSVVVALVASTNQLDQVVVTGTVIPTELKAVPNAITVITAKQLEERGVTRIDQLFRGEVPGLFVLNTGTANVSGSDDGNPWGEVVMYSRGATAMDGAASAGTKNNTNPIKTYIDGVELANPSYLSQIDPKNIERIEILTGPQASTIYGSNAINGVMQIFTKRGQAGRPQLVLEVGSGVTQNNFSAALAPAHHGSASLSGTEGRWSYNLGSSANYVGSWTPGIQTTAVGGYGGARAQFGALTTDISMQLRQTQNLQRGSFVQALLSHIQDGDYLATSFNGSSQTGRVPPKQATLDGQTFAVSLKYQPTAWWSHSLTLGNDQSNTQTITSGAGFNLPSDTLLTLSQTWNARTSQQYTTTVNGTVTSRTNFTLTFGADHWQTHSATLGARTLALTGNLATPSIARVRPGKNAGAFAQGQFGIMDALFLTYGVRAERNPNYGDKVKVLPGRYGIAYTRSFGPMTAKLRGSYGRSTRPPADAEKFPISAVDATALGVFGTYDTQLANPYLGPEYQQGGEGGLDLYIGNRGSLVITRYNQTVDNLITVAQAIDSVRSLTQYPAAIFSLYGSCGIYSGTSGPYCYARQSEYVNAASIRNQGWELQGTMNFGPLTTRGTYSWTKSRVLGITPQYRALFNPINYYDYQPGYTFERVAEHTWAINIGYVHAKTSVSLAFDGTGTIPGSGGDALRWETNTGRRLRVYASPRFVLPNTYDPPAPGYAMADLTASHQLTSSLETTLSMTNLTNSYHNDVNYQAPVPGRVTNLGLRIRL